MSPSPFSVDYLVPKKTEAEFATMRQEGTIYNSPFPQGNYISTKAASTEIFTSITQSDTFQVVATYISSKDQITGLKIQRFKKKNDKWEEKEEVLIDTKQIGVLEKFLQFLINSDIPSLSAGKLSLDQNLQIDENLISKIKTLSSDEEGKKQLNVLFNEGYLTSGLDIPELIKKGLTKTKIEEKKQAIAQFKLLIEQPNIKEVADIQNFLKNNPWVFGPEYKLLDFRNAGDEGNPDGRLKRIDGLSDILEVKLPSEEILREDSKNRQYIAPKLSESLGQLIGYLEHYYNSYTNEKNDDTGEEVKEELQGKYYKPKGILLIGRRDKELVNKKKTTISADPKCMRKLLSYFHWVEVLTYDDLIERAENGLNNILI